MTAASQDTLIGRRVFGGYTITGTLGEGGMGAVYVAEHRGLDRRIAVKVLHESMTRNQDIVSRFLAEARAASALDHPTSSMSSTRATSTMDACTLRSSISTVAR